MWCFETLLRIWEIKYAKQQMIRFIKAKTKRIYLKMEDKIMSPEFDDDDFEAEDDDDDFE
jgi:hypothetical protein